MERGERDEKLGGGSGSLNRRGGGSGISPEARGNGAWRRRRGCAGLGLVRRSDRRGQEAINAERTGRSNTTRHTATVPARAAQGGVHAAAVGRIPVRGRGPGGVNVAPGDDVGTHGQSQAARAVVSEQTRDWARLGARRQACQPRAHHANPCLVATMA